MDKPNLFTLSVEGKGRYVVKTSTRKELLMENSDGTTWEPSRSALTSRTESS